MGAVKVSISLPEEELEWVRAEARRQRSTVSAVMNEAVAAARRHRALGRYLKEVGAPKPTPEEIEEMQREWDGD